MVRRILRPMIGLGLVDRPVEVGPVAAEAHARTAREIAEQGIVLLKNADEVLPIGSDVTSIAVIGPEADNVSAAGAGSGFLRPLHEVSPLDGIRRRAGADVRVIHAYGADALSAADLLPGPPAIPSAYLAPPDGQGSGLRAEYWANPNFEGEPLLTRTDPQVAINLGFFNIPHFNAISPRLPATPMELNGRISVRWRGTLTAGHDRNASPLVDEPGIGEPLARRLHDPARSGRRPPRATRRPRRVPAASAARPRRGPSDRDGRGGARRRGGPRDRGGVRRRLGRAERPDRRPAPARLGAPAGKHPAARPRGGRISPPNATRRWWWRRRTRAR